MERYVSVDIGGTSIKYGLLNEHGEFLQKAQMDTEAVKGGSHILQKVKSIVGEYLEQYKASGVCISTAGMVNCEKGEIFYSGELIPNYTGTQFKKEIEAEFGITCEVENDVNCAGLAEYISGAAQGSSSAVCLTVGTGIGGCIILDGKVFHGFSNSACEIGYMHMDDTDFQTLGASSILSKNVAKAKWQSPEKWPGVRIFEEAKKRDVICNREIDRMADILAKGTANICYVLNPEVVVFGGGIMAQKDFLKPKIQKALERQLKPVIYEQTRIAFAKHGNDAGMLGAFYNFRNKHL